MASMDALLAGFASRLQLVEKTLGINGGGAAAAAPVAAASEDVAPFVVAYDAYCGPHLENVAKACAAIGGDEAAELSALVATAWGAQRAFLVMASQCKKPADLMAALKQCGVVDACVAAGKATKRGAFELHYKCVAESVGALNWLMASGTGPKEMVESQVGAADFHGNKIRLAYKRNTDKFDANQHLLVDSLKKLLTELLVYVKAHHLTGVAWNFQGQDSAAFSPAAAPAAAPAVAPAAGGGGGAGATTNEGGGIADLKAELARKGNAAAGLNKVTKDMQTWRPDYKGGDAAKAAPVPKKAAVAKRPVVVKVKGDKQVAFKRQGMRWCVEAQTKDDGVVTVEVMDAKHSVAVYGCFQATIDIKGKCKGVTLDSCEQVKLLCDNVLSSVELVNCKRMQVQIRGMAPTVAIDKTDGCLVYLSKEGLETTFTAAKSSEMNVNFPNPQDPEGDLIECPIPEQYVHKVVLDKGAPHVSAEVSDLYTH